MYEKKLTVKLRRKRVSTHQYAKLLKKKNKKNKNNLHLKEKIK